jgi:hypothetical protein
MRVSVHARGWLTGGEVRDRVVALERDPVRGVHRGDGWRLRTCDREDEDTDGQRDRHEAAEPHEALMDHEFKLPS